LAFLGREHKYILLSKADFTGKEYHIIEKQLISFITVIQADKYAYLQVNYKTDADQEIIKP
jgi:hypothetical protein